jgi:hypothetical protein
MTHTESQDLLLDLACGELDAARAAEVESHLSGCAECRQEKAALDEARRMAAPLRELEQPSPAFDEPILRAARAQAQLEHDGNVGQVIEVTGTVRAMGLDAARVDAHGPVKARPVERLRPRWVIRAAVGGSVAAAAALALVVSNTLETRRNAEKAAAAVRTGEFEIRVQPTAPQALDSALRAAENKRAKGQAEERDRAAKPVAPALPEKSSEKVAQLPMRRPAQHDVASGGNLRGSGGDAVVSVRKKAALQAKEGAADAVRPRPPAPSSGEQVAAASGPAPSTPSSPPQVAAVSRAEPSSPSVEPPAAAAARPRRDSSAVPMSKAESQLAQAASPAPGASGAEAKAQEARHSGNYLLAASLYRDAAAMRSRDGDPAAAAWDLAHAVECLSAVARFDEAKEVRDELARLYPSETTALAAARRALRTVDPPPAAPAER